MLPFLSSDARKLVVVFTVAALIFFVWGFIANDYKWQYFGAAGVLVVLSLIIIGINYKDRNKLKSLLLPLLLGSALLASCQQVRSAAQQATAQEEVIFHAPRMVTDSAGWTQPALVSAH
ncbi:hypothetical protein DNI29_11540 [Hymenobacter sediminis]|uniref:hypothetical protein n=1 Tax=Hymenobacter sediminis TaxID=2218621 RepID=UPI000DA6DAF1|nr:hypothetical protein [Hymenobacter sediminis]RPD46791.1 hypothetical protein DNI29_11540 [Hymenobacter sediminis]